MSLPPAVQGSRYRDTPWAASATRQLALLGLVGEGEVLPSHSKAACAGRACAAYVTPALLPQNMIFFSSMLLVRKKKIQEKLSTNVAQGVSIIYCLSA